jgi:histidinol phosphatase-like enzyme
MIRSVSTNAHYCDLKISWHVLGSMCDLGAGDDVKMGLRMPTISDRKFITKITYWVCRHSGLHSTVGGLPNAGPMKTLMVMSVRGAGGEV